MINKMTNITEEEITKQENNHIEREIEPIIAHWRIKVFLIDDSSTWAERGIGIGNLTITPTESRLLKIIDEVNSTTLLDLLITDDLDYSRQKCMLII